MTQSLSDTVVEFDIHRSDFNEMMRWIFTLSYDTWWTEKTADGRIIGFSFRFPEDAVAFRLKFNI